MKAIFLSALLALPQLLWSQDSPILRTYSLDQAQEDFDLMVSSLKEAHAGLYWYSSPGTFDSLVTQERQLLYDGIDSYAFFRIASRIVAATREGHCAIASPRDVGRYFNTRVKILPIIVKVLDNKVYLLNNIAGKATAGKWVTGINGSPIQEVLNLLFRHSAKYADGYIETGKIRFTIDYAGLAYHYADYFENLDNNTLELLDPKTGIASTISVASVSSGDFRDIESPYGPRSFDDPITLHLEGSRGIAQLALHSFRHTYYDEDGDEGRAFDVFRQQIDSAFAAIQAAGIQHLVIDIRNNTGGTEGYEDYVLSYLTKTTYKKYRYVQANALSFSFLDHTQHNTSERKQAFEADMRDEFVQNVDGRYLRRADYAKVAHPQEEVFEGQLYILTSGRTYSGGAEFAALAKANTSAVFVGEETAGGYYGQTSGYSLILTLPHSGTRIKIPLLKFVTDVPEETIPIGRGTLPDHAVSPTYEEYSQGVDAEKDFTLQLIEGQ